MKRVIVCAPTSDRHAYVLDEWLEALSKQTYKHDILLIDTSDSSKYFKLLKSKGLRVLRMRWNPEKNDIAQHLADCREVYRKIAVKENYDYIFNLDTDTILPIDGIEELVKADKDQISYVVHVFPKGVYRPPCVFKEGGFKLNQKKERDNGLQYYSWSWVYKNKGKLKKVYASALGVLLVKRKVFKEVPFRTHPSFVMGEDLWYYAEAHDKGFESWCYVKRVPHKNAPWNEVVGRRNKLMKIDFAFGRTDAKRVEQVNKVYLLKDEPHKISVIMPLYNHENYVGEAIQSVLDQKYKNFELIIINDGSTDKSAEIVKQFKDRRIKLIELKENKGIGIVRNEGVKHATGKFISFLSSDDKWTPEFLITMVSLLDTYPDCMAFCSYNVMNEKGKHLTQNVLFNKSKDYFGAGIKLFEKEHFEQEVRKYALNNDMFVCYDCILGKAEYFKGRNGFGKFRYGEDLYHLLKSVLKNKIQYLYVPTALAEYRRHSMSTTEKVGLETLIENNKQVFKQLEKEGVKL